MARPAKPQAEWHAASALHRGTMPKIIKRFGPLVVVRHNEPGCRSRRLARRQLTIEGGSPLGQWVTESALHKLCPGDWRALSVNCSADRQVAAVNHRRLPSSYGERNRQITVRGAIPTTKIGHRPGNSEHLVDASGA